MENYYVNNYIENNCVDPINYGNEIDTLERSEIEVKEYSNYTDIYIWILLPALILGLFIEFYKRFFLRSMF